MLPRPGGPEGPPEPAAKDIPNCRLVEIPEVGHVPHLEAPEQFQRALLDFLEK